MDIPQMDYETLIHQLKYARWDPKTNRRETWDATVNRLREYLKGLPVVSRDTRIAEELECALSSVENKEIMPSMRLLAMAGEAATRENLTIYNCMYMTIDDWSKLPKLMFALMCGTGVGFSVEEPLVSLMKMPEEPIANGGEPCVVTFEDSRWGWAHGYEQYLYSLLSGRATSYDVSKIRPAGSPLKVTGGYASGPEPLVELLIFTHKFISQLQAQRRGPSPLEVYDLCCKVADVVVQGGVRRSACIAFFSPEDEQMWNAKQAEHIKDKPWRHNTNNSVMFADETQALYYLPRLLDSVKTSGEPGIAIRSVLRRKARASGRIIGDNEFIGMNPCGEVILRDMQVCNLTEIVVRPGYSFEQLERLVELGTFLGCLQATQTNIHPSFSDTIALCKYEPLLGVSLTGLMDDPVLVRGGCEALDYYRDRAKLVADYWAPIMGLRNITAVTCVKPSGTVSKLVGCSPGVHPPFADYYLSNISIPADTPINQLLADAGVPVRWKNTRTGASSVVYSFPLKSPSDTPKMLSALGQLDVWRRVNKAWAHHNVSCTIYVQDDEWPQVEAWLRKNIGIVSGITFIPAFDSLDHVSYMPLERISAEEYRLRCERWPKIPWHDLRDSPEYVSSAQEFSCTSKEGCTL